MYFFSLSTSIEDLTLKINRFMATINETNSTSAGHDEHEINLLRDYFKDNIRILSSIGQFSYILKIRADQYDVSLTLQLDSKPRIKFAFLI